MHSNEYSQELRYYPFAVKLDKYVGFRDTLMTYLTRHVFQIKKYLKIQVFNMITKKMNKKFQQKIYNANVNVDLMEKCNSNQ